MSYLNRQSRNVASLVFILALILMLGACVAPPSQPGATEGEEAAVVEETEPVEEAMEGPQGTLTVVQGLLPITADPHIEYLNSSWHVNYSIYDPLSRVDHNGDLQYYLATDWELESDTTWIVHLRKGVEWHDGEPFTAEDVVWSIKRILDPETQSIWGRIYSFVTDAEAIDDYTVRFTTAYTTVAVPQDFGRMAILPKHRFEEVGQDAFFQNPIGTGPFKFVNQVPGEQITLEANEDYWGGAPKVERLIFRQVPDASTRVAELLSGNADVVDAIPPNEVERINNSDIAHVVTAPTVRRIILDFALSTTPELEDIRIRKAVAHAIDTEAINEAIYNGQAGVQTGWLDHFSWGKNEDLTPYEYDPEKSKELLAEAGYPDGMPIKFMMGEGRFLLDREVGLAIADYLEEGGFDVDFQVYEWGTFSQMRAAEELEGIYMLSSGNSTGEPDQVFRSYDSNRSAIYIIDPELVDLIVQQQQERDPAERMGLVAEVDRYIHEKVYGVNLMTVPGFYGLNNRVEGFVPSPFEIFNFTNVSVTQ